MHQVITSFAGLRAHEDKNDFIIGEAYDAKGFFDVAGIESPGLSSAPAIGAMVGGMIKIYLSLTEKENYIEKRKGIIDTDTLSIEEMAELIKEDPSYGNIICRCEMVSEGEILDAIHRPLGAKTLDAIKRRTRAGAGRCQAGFCTSKLISILERELNTSIMQITKSGHNSTIIIGQNKDIE
jgi:glycerol-3-phosphate dehydrogenase